jgi:hypothetical protein
MKATILIFNILFVTALFALSEGDKEIMKKHINESIGHYTDYMEAENAYQSNKISRIGPISVNDSDPSTEQIIDKSLEKCLLAAKKVSDEFLDWAHPELKFHYKNYFIGGLELILEGRRKDDISMQVMGNIRRNKWIVFQNAHGSYLGSKLTE